MTRKPATADMHANYSYSLRRVGTLGAGASDEAVGPWHLMDAGLGDSNFNIGVVRSAVDDPGAALAMAREWFAARGLRAFRLDLRSDADAALVAAALHAGFAVRWQEPALSLHPIPDQWTSLPELDVRPVQSAADARSFAHLESEEHRDHGFQVAMTKAAARLDGCTLILGTVAGRPVARAMAVVTDRLVGIHNVYVPPSARRQGYGAAITVAAIEVGLAAGAQAACLEATELGLPVYLRLGFVRRYDYVVVGSPA